MGTRRLSREMALQALFFMDIRNDVSEQTLELFSTTFDVSNRAKDFFFELSKGVIKFKSDLDSLIEQFSDNWKINRMSCVDRNILRIATYEMLHCADIPPKVSINEAIDIGKRFSTDESGAFINGILDRIRKEGMD